MISDDLELDERSLKEPVAGTSRMQDIDSSQMITDDGFGGSSFGRKYFINFFDLNHILIVISSLFHEQKSQLRVYSKVIYLPMHHYHSPVYHQWNMIRTMIWMVVGIWEHGQQHQGKLNVHTHCV